MTEPLGFLSAILGILQKIKDLFPKIDTRIALASMLAGFLTFALTVTAYILIAHPFSPSTQWVRLGGLDLGRYCSSYAYDSNDEDSCSSHIDLNKVCAWQYSAPNAFAVVPGVYSARCYAPPPPGTYLGGIADMRGYCQETFKGSADVQARVTGSTWVCQTKIIKEVACSWQYQEKDVQARNEGGVWYCYTRAAS